MENYKQEIIKRINQSQKMLLDLSEDCHWKSDFQIHFIDQINKLQEFKEGLERELITNGF